MQDRHQFIAAAGTTSHLFPLDPAATVFQLGTILASVVARESRPYVVGFAAETGGVDRAIEKARDKHVDLMVYNDVGEPGSGFGTDTNRVIVIGREGSTDTWPMMAKEQVASRLFDRIMEDVARKG